MKIYGASFSLPVELAKHTSSNAANNMTVVTSTVHQDTSRQAGEEHDGFDGVATNASLKTLCIMRCRP
jgi:hypothetical protein